MPTPVPAHAGLALLCPSPLHILPDGMCMPAVAVQVPLPQNDKNVERQTVLTFDTGMSKVK